MPTNDVLEAIEPYERMYEIKPARGTTVIETPEFEEQRPHAQELQADPLDKYIVQGEAEADCN